MLSVPPLPRPTVTPLARLSPTGKLRVELLGAEVGTGPTKAAPAAVWLVTVRLPVTATAVLGTPPRPVTWKVRGTPALNLPARPVPKRESSRRAGATAT